MHTHWNTFASRVHYYYYRTFALSTPHCWGWTISLWASEPKVLVYCDRWYKTYLHIQESATKRTTILMCRAADNLTRLDSRRAIPFRSDENMVNVASMLRHDSAKQSIYLYCCSTLMMVATIPKPTEQQWEDTQLYTAYIMRQNQKSRRKFRRRQLELRCLKYTSQNVSFFGHMMVVGKLEHNFGMSALRRWDRVAGQTNNKYLRRPIWL